MISLFWMNRVNKNTYLHNINACINMYWFLQEVTFHYLIEPCILNHELFHWSILIIFCQRNKNIRRFPRGLLAVLTFCRPEAHQDSSLIQFLVYWMQPSTSNPRDFLVDWALEWSGMGSGGHWPLLGTIPHFGTNLLERHPSLIFLTRCWGVCFQDSLMFPNINKMMYLCI